MLIGVNNAISCAIFMSFPLRHVGGIRAEIGNFIAAAATPPAGRGEHAKLWGSLRCNSFRSVPIVCGTKVGIAMTEDILEGVVQHGRPDVEEGLHRHPVPAHLLSCPFSRVPDAKSHPVIFVPVDFF